ncbi:MAG: FAD-containing oxidoreductase [Candidatus Rokuibacteriota bacterium]|nr:MAG: FAD-containing oxidoreductase [Candidatus Rokubacteria bacterium]
MPQRRLRAIQVRHPLLARDGRRARGRLSRRAGGGGRGARLRRRHGADAERARAPQPSRLGRALQRARGGRLPRRRALHGAGHRGGQRHAALVQEGRHCRVRARLSHHDSAERFSGLGVDVFLGDARFTGPDTVEVNGTRLSFRKAVIATGARAHQPDVPGLREAGFLTNENVFELTQRPSRLAVIGAGPIGCELAQAFRRLGSEVTLFHTGDHILNREDADAAEIVQRAFVDEGIRLVLGAKLERVERAGGGKVLLATSPSGPVRVEVDEILVGTGREPNVDGLGLEAVGVAYDRRDGVQVNDRLQTTNPRIYAAGDICMPEKFTHVADAAARVVIQNALFLGRKKHSALTIPWCTYTDPEIAHVGLYARDAEKRGMAVDTYLRPFAEVDRAVADGEEDGFVKVHVRRGTDTIVGATIVARHAGEMINELTLAMTAGIGLGRLASVIHPYPTQAEAIRQTGDMYNRTRLTPTVRKLFAAWLRWTR